MFQRFALIFKFHPFCGENLTVPILITFSFEYLSFFGKTSWDYLRLIVKLPAVNFLSSLLFHIHDAHGILQVRILEWVAFLFSRRSFQPRDKTQVSGIARRFFTSWAKETINKTKRQSFANYMIDKGLIPKILTPYVELIQLNIKKTSNLLF